MRIRILTRFQWALQRLLRLIIHILIIIVSIHLPLLIPLTPPLLLLLLLQFISWLFLLSLLMKRNVNGFVISFAFITAESGTVSAPDGIDRKSGEERLRSVSFVS